MSPGFGCGFVMLHRFLMNEMNIKIMTEHHVITSRANARNIAYCSENIALIFCCDFHGASVK
jgi:hypothetical protein